MLRGFRHTVFLMLQVGVLLSAGAAYWLWPDAWRAIALCVAGALASSLVCERIASRYLRRTLGQLRRAADDLSRGRTRTIETQPGADFHKLIQSMNVLAKRLAEAGVEEQRLQEELRRRERLAFLGELAASVAHEVNNPLDGVQNCSGILRRSLHDADRARQMLDLMDDGLRRIELIVRRLLTLARQNVIRAQPVDLAGVVEAAVDATAGRCHAAGVQVRRDALGPRVQADPQLLEQVFVNLILNAVDSMPNGGVVTLTIADEEPLLAGRDGAARAEWVRVDVCDQGGGIPADVLPHIFEPFFTTKKDGRGTGLGLPLAARIVDAHRGEITVANRPEGGTCLCVRLPVSHAHGPRREEARVS